MLCTCNENISYTGYPGCLAGIDKKIAEKEERSRQRKVEDEKRKKGASTSSTSHELLHQN